MEISNIPRNPVNRPVQQQPVQVIPQPQTQPVQQPVAQQQQNINNVGNRRRIII